MKVFLFLLHFCSIKIRKKQRILLQQELTSVDNRLDILVLIRIFLCDTSMSVFLINSNKIIDDFPLITLLRNAWLTLL